LEADDGERRLSNEAPPRVNSTFELPADDDRFGDLALEQRSNGIVANAECFGEKARGRLQGARAPVTIEELPPRPDPKRVPSYPCGLKVSATPLMQ
jgi:hypothetical protein